MKTSELKSFLKGEYAFQEFNGFIIIEGNIEVGVTLGWLRILTQNFNTLRNLTLLEKVLEYAKTPLEEREVDPEEVAQTKPIDVEQIEMWQDIQESLNVGSLGVYEKRKLSNLIAMQIEKLKGNL